VGGRIVGYGAAVLMATFGASPFIESFTLSGELLASLPAVLSLLAFTGYLRNRDRRWLLLAGLLTGCAVMVKQSAFDAGLAAVAFLLITQRRRALPNVALLVGGAALPVLAAVMFARDSGEWSAAVVAYRWRGDSILTGSLTYRLGLFGDSMPAAAYALGLIALLAVIGWSRAPLIARLWLGAALVGVLGGGNFHYHYYQQLVPPLCVLGGFGVARLLRERRRTLVLAASAVAVTTVAVTAPLWFRSSSAQARAIWPRDPHLLHDAEIARYVRAHTRPNDKVLMIWAAANVYYLSDREPALRYMWFRNIQTLPGALAQARRVLAARVPKLVVVVQDPNRIDKAGVTKQILRAEYEHVSQVDGVPIYRPRPR
jgi:4-amino-4-deoxy-L-arabinose transferase-like glycosyltransferase